MKAIKLFVLFTAAVLTLGVFGGSMLRMDKDFAEGAPTKKVAFLGDSYVQNHRRPITEAWHYHWAENHKYHYLNYGRNGNCVYYQNKSGAIMMKRFAEIPKDVDAIVIIAGHNDACVPTKEGVEAEPFFKDFAAAVPKFLANVKKHYPQAKIVWITPWQVDKPGFKEAIAAIKAGCEQEGVPCCDATAFTGIQPNDAEMQKKYYQAPKDTAHLNAAGHQLMLEKISPWLDKVLGW